MLMNRFGDLSYPDRDLKSHSSQSSYHYSVLNRPTSSSVNHSYSSSSERGESSLWRIASVGQDNRDELDKIDGTPNERLHLYLYSFFHCGKITVVTPLST